MVEEKKVIISICKEGKACPYLNNGSVFQILAERDCLKERVEKMEGVIELARKNTEKLQEEIKNLKNEKQSLKEELNQVSQEQLKRFFERNKREQPARKRGAPIGHPGRGRQRPVRIDQYIDIWPSQCNHCGRQNITVYPQSFEERIVQDIQKYLWIRDYTSLTTGF